MIYKSTSGVVTESFNDYWDSFGDFLPNLLSAILLILIGFVVAWTLESVVHKILKAFKIDTAFEKLGVQHLFEKGGFAFSFSKFFSKIVYWFILIVFLSSSAEVLGLTQIQDFLSRLVNYLPNVIGAIAILTIGLLVAGALSEVVRKATVAPDVKSSHFLVNFTKWSIVLFTLIAALAQLGIATKFLEILFAGLVIMIALAGGLAFGLGGKEAAKSFIDRWQQRY